MRERITFRACLISGLVTCLIACLLPDIAFKLKGTGGGPGYLRVLVVFPALLAGVAFAAARRFLPRVGLMAPRVFFASLLVGLSTFVTAAFIVGLLPSLYYYATPENDMELIFPGVPKHLVPFSPDRVPEDRARMELFYRGLPEGPGGVPWYNRSLPDEPLEPGADLGAALDEPFREMAFVSKRLPRSFEKRKAVWQCWAGPFLWWMTLLALIYAAQFCLAGILRKQWVENEKLMFPHAEAVADAVSPPKKGLLRSNLFWIGAGVCVFIYALEGLHHHFPAFPRIELFGSPLHALSLAEVFSQHPWRALKHMLSVQPYIICIAFLLTTELSFSVWFFAILDNVVRLGSAHARLPRVWDDAINYYYINSGSDQVGAVIVLVVFLLWTSRRELARIFKRALYGAEPVDSDEFISYRVCVFGFLASTVGILAWCVYAGMNLFIAAFLFGVFYLILVYTSRLLSELGLVTASASYFTPHLLFIRLFGYNHETMLNTFAVNTFVWSPIVYTGTHACPVVLTSFKLTGSAKEGKRTFALYLFVLAVATAAIFFYCTVRFAYVNGALNTEREGYYSSTKWIFENTFLRDIVFKDRSHAPDTTAITAMFIGAGVMGFLLAMRRLFYWWPLHPLGYVALSIDGIWFSFFLGWLVKRAVLKYGGGGALPRATEFFLGLFAGQFFMAGFWFLVGCIGGDASFGFM